MNLKIVQMNIKIVQINKKIVYNEIVQMKKNSSNEKKRVQMKNLQKNW